MPSDNSIHSTPVGPAPMESGVDRSPTTERTGAALWLAGLVTFLVAMTVTELTFGCANMGGCYNALTNPISDLGSAGFAGNPPYYVYNGVHVPWPTSPLWPLFNFGIVVFGVLIVAGVFLLARGFPASRWTNLSLAVFAIAGFGSAGVGVVPEDTNLTLHAIFALFAFAGSGISVLLMGLGMPQDRRWGRAWFVYSIASGAFALAAVVVFILPSAGVLPAWPVYGNGFGYGGMERLIIAAPFLWLILASLSILRRPVTGAATPAPSAAPPIYG